MKNLSAQKFIDSHKTTEELMYWHILAIGPFSKKISSHLEYDCERYLNVPVGYTVLKKIFWSSGLDTALYLMECFGITVISVEGYELDPYKLDLSLIYGTYFEEDVESFLIFREAGFKFYFRPIS